MFSKKLNSVIHQTQKLAKEKNIEVYSLEMLLNEILQDEEVVQHLQAHQVSVYNIREELNAAVIEFEKEQPKSTEVSDPQPDDIVTNVMARASLHIKKSLTKKLSEIGLFDILASALMEEDSEAFLILDNWDVKRSMLTEMLNKDPIENRNFEDSSMHEDHHISRQEMNKDDEDKLPEGIMVNLTEKAKQGSFMPMIGREDEILTIATILSRKTKSNPIITGEAGVGKTAIIEGLATKIANGEIFEELKDKVIYSLNIGVLLSGTKYRGDFEKRIVNILKEVKKEKNAIIFIDEIHTILGAGSAGGSMDMANLLKPELTSGDLTIIGATTSEEYRNIFEKNSALARRFNQVKVKELTGEQTVELLHGIKNDFAKYHSVEYAEGVFETIVQVTARYLPTKHFPDKAIDFLDQISATIRLDKSRDQILRKEDVYKLISKISGVPIDDMMDNNESNETILKLNTLLKERVFGQDKAVDVVSESMLLSYAGLKEENKPIGSYLCVGPTGVGKTELAKTLADKLNLNLVRFDMSEFSESHSVAKLIGSPPGYTGHDEGALITKEMRENAHSVVLFDEFEKAHPTIYNIFLQILEEGEIKDSQGNVISFKDTIIIFTSNAGVIKSDNEGRSIGFGADHNVNGMDMDSIKNSFPPEFRNRLSAVLEFEKLKPESIRMITNKALENLCKLLKKNKGIEIKFKDDLVDYISAHGFDEKMGARPIERKVKEVVSTELAKKILTESLTEGDKVTLGFNKKKEIIQIRATKAKK